MIDAARLADELRQEQDIAKWWSKKVKWWNKKVKVTEQESEMFETKVEKMQTGVDEVNALKGRREDLKQD